MVDLVLDAECLRQVGGFHHCGQAALVRYVAAQIVGGTLGQPDRIGVQTTGGKFGGHDGDIQLFPQFDVIVDILVGHRVFVPIEAHLLDRAADP